MNTPYIRIRLKSVEYLKGFVGKDFTIALTPISLPSKPVTLNFRLNRGKTKLVKLEILELSSNTTFNPFIDKFKLESRLTESGTDETFPDNSLTAFELPPPPSGGSDLSPNHKTWTYEREQIIKETGGNQYTTKEATLKLVFEIEIKQSVDLTSEEQDNFPFGIAGGLDSFIQNKIMDSRIKELRNYARGLAAKVANFCDFRNLLTIINSISDGRDIVLNDFEKMIVWLEVFQYHMEKVFLIPLPLVNITIITFPHLDTRGLNSALTSSGSDSFSKNIPAHIVVPVEDGHHGLASHISHDQRVPMPTAAPSWAELKPSPIVGGFTEENMKNNEWWHSWPTLDSAISNKDTRFISKGYMRIYTAERKGTIEDARASLGTIEAFRAYRKSGFRSYATTWISIFIDPKAC